VVGAAAAENSALAFTASFWPNSVELRLPYTSPANTTSDVPPAAPPLRIWMLNGTAEQKMMITAARSANADVIGELLYPVGVMEVQPRLHIVLGLALTGGCLPSGELKPTATTTPEITVGD